MRLSTPCYLHSYWLFNSISKVVFESGCDCISLSGGIDTSVIAAIAASIGLKPKAYITIYKDGLPKDITYAEHVSRSLGLKLKYVFLDRIKAQRIAEKVVNCVGEEQLRSHSDGGCVELRNDVVFYSTLEEAFRDGCSCVLLGSGGDELFAGYKFMLGLSRTELEETIEKMVRGRFPELQIARCIGVKVIAPLLDERVITTALKIPVDCLRSLQLQGKEVLRLILEDLGLWEVALRPKTPAEEGCGTKSMCTSPYDEDCLYVV